MVLVRDPLEIRAEGEIPGRAQITDERVKPFDVGIALEDALKLPEQGLLAVVGEKACGHVRLLLMGEPLRVAARLGAAIFPDARGVV
jgi:hypothetical protein